MALKHIILGLLRAGPMHGYRLRKSVREASWMYPANSINIYPSLHSLEKDGFVEHTSEIHEGRARKIYQILDSGVDELQSWLTQETEEPASTRDQVALKIAMLNDSSSLKARGWIESALEDYRREVERLSQGESDDSEGLPFRELTREYGLRLAELRVKFLEDVLSAEPG